MAADLHRLHVRSTGLGVRPELPRPPRSNSALWPDSRSWCSSACAAPQHGAEPDGSRAGLRDLAKLSRAVQREGLVLGSEQELEDMVVQLGCPR